MGPRPPGGDISRPRSRVKGEMGPKIGAGPCDPNLGWVVGDPAGRSRLRVAKGAGLTLARACARWDQAGKPAAAYGTQAPVGDISRPRARVKGEMGPKIGAGPCD